MRMKVLLKCLLVVWGLSVWTAVARPETAAFEAERALVQRIAPGIADRVIFAALPPEGEEHFTLSSDAEGRLVVAGDTISARTAGFGHYLREIARREVFWEGNNAADLQEVVRLDAPVTRSTPLKYRVYFNYCTLSYSLAFADWARWEREIDLMALYGVNLPLGVVGLEAVWRNTLVRLGWTDAEARAFLVGPAHLAWQWMTNIESFDGPLDAAWIDAHAELGRRIHARELSLGMRPIQQGFTGYVPRLTAAKFPAAQVKLQPNWSACFKGSAQLDPLDPLFPKFAAVFYEEQAKLFGAHGFYAADPFHESAPPQKGRDYLSAVGREIWRAMQAADTNAVLVMQSWSLRMPILRAIPQDRALVLDIGGTRCFNVASHWTGQEDAGIRGFDGAPFVVGDIWNFGGRNRSGGDLSDIAYNKHAWIRAQFPTNCVGAGLFPEGIETSPIYFALQFDFLWRQGGVTLADWLPAELGRRYRLDAATCRPLADGLLATIYGKGWRRSASIIAARPRFDVAKSDPNDHIRTCPAPQRLYDLWRAYGDQAAALPADRRTPGFVFDFVDVGRAVMSDLLVALHAEVIDAYLSRDRARTAAAMARFRELARDLDAYLACAPLFDAVPRFAAARGWESNYARQLTQWGSTDGWPWIYDYAWKEWSGLVRGYYLPRWEIFHAAVDAALAKGVGLEKIPKDQHGRTQYRGTPLTDALADFEEAWIRRPALGRPATTDDVLVQARNIQTKYADEFARLLKTPADGQLAAAIARLAAAEGTVGGGNGRDFNQ